MNDGATLRRDLAAAALVVSSMLGLLSNALLPDLPADHAARLVALHDAGTTAVVSAVAFLLMQLPFAVAMLGLGHLLRRRAPRTSAAGVLLGVLGAFGHTVFGGLSMVYLTMASSPRTAYADLYRRIESGPVMLLAVLGLVGTVLGLVLLAIAMLRSHVVPAWIPWLVLAFVVLEFAGAALSQYASAASAACLVVAFSALAVHLHRMPVADWRAPSYAEEPVGQQV